jgi:uncharacterized protein (DUF1697 family)
MADLKALYESLHLMRVETYIQSGNVIFRSKSTSPAALEAMLEKAIEQSFGFTVTVIVRRPADLQKIIRKPPTFVSGMSDETRLYVTFLKSIPDLSLVKTLASAPAKGTDRFKVVGSEIYIHCPNGYGKSALSNTYFEKRLNLSATTRNWRTVKTLFTLSGRPDKSEP